MKCYLCLKSFIGDNSNYDKGLCPECKIFLESYYTGYNTKTTYGSTTFSSTYSGPAIESTYIPPMIPETLKAIPEQEPQEDKSLVEEPQKRKISFED